MVQIIIIFFFFFFFFLLLLLLLRTDPSYLDSPTFPDMDTAATDRQTDRQTTTSMRQ